ncbi:hypothetical protein [Helicobacter sp.]|nr:hypothetical protein [Helicobacter sp.]MBR2494297.1 hypothetical protein [Helicobacter sp.]
MERDKSGFIFFALASKGRQRACFSTTLQCDLESTYASVRVLLSANLSFK